MNTKFRTEAKSNFGKKFFKLMNKLFSEKQWKM